MFKRILHNSKKKEGFTLIELMIVIVILGILATVAVQQYSGATARANTAKAQADIRTLMSSLEIFKMDTNSYPTTAQTLSVLVTNPTPAITGWRGPYIKAVPNDPFAAAGTSYTYTSDGATYAVTAAGPSGNVVTSSNLQ